MVKERASGRRIWHFVKTRKSPEIKILKENFKRKKAWNIAFKDPPPTIRKNDYFLNFFMIFGKLRASQEFFWKILKIIVGEVLNSDRYRQKNFKLGKLRFWAFRSVRKFQTLDPNIMHARIKQFAIKTLSPPYRLVSIFILFSTRAQKKSLNKLRFFSDRIVFRK